MHLVRRLYSLSLLQKLKRLRQSDDDLIGLSAGLNRWAAEGNKKEITQWHIDLSDCCFYGFLMAVFLQTGWDFLHGASEGG